MLKNIVAPVQAWLLSQNRCVGCGMPLTQAAQSTKNAASGKLTIVICKCKRIYVYDPMKKKYRRALMTEIE